MHISVLRQAVGREIVELRQDLRELKKCQLQYFVTAVAGTGAIWSLAGSFADEYSGLVLLAPLAILLPTWVIFFDKATTITRAVGYQRILESQFCAESQVYTCLGYENALALFRKKEGQAWEAIRNDLKYGRPSLWSVVLLRTRHRFWMLNWYTFAVLALTCCLASYYVLGGFEHTLLLLIEIRFSTPQVALLIVLICAIYTLWTIYSLVYGGLSYDACYKKWEWIFASIKSDSETRE